MRRAIRVGAIGGLVALIAVGNGCQAVEDWAGASGDEYAHHTEYTRNEASSTAKAATPAIDHTQAGVHADPEK